MTITGQHNRRLKEIRKLRMRRRWRERRGLFVAEGEDLLAAADAAGWEAIERYAAAGSGLEGTPVEPSLLASASGIASGTRALGVYEERWVPEPLGPLCIYLHSIHDPGNLGTVIRSAEAFGAASVALGPQTADPFGPKAVRASMGAIFSMPMARASTVAELPGVKIALVPRDGKRLDQLERIGEVSIMIGSERDGLPQELIEQADHVAQIPIHSNSLNAAMAATIALYELALRMQRQ
jgi:TrmH family RNA methyltransferase